MTALSCSKAHRWWWPSRPGTLIQVTIMIPSYCADGRQRSLNSSRRRRNRHSRNHRLTLNLHTRLGELIIESIDCVFVAIKGTHTHTGLIRLPAAFDWKWLSLLLLFILRTITGCRGCTLGCWWFTCLEVCALQRLSRSLATILRWRADNRPS